MNQIREWDGSCQKCNTETNVHTMSIFDVTLICMECADREKNHPRYQTAKKAELEALVKGDPNFSGIGHDKSDDAEG